MDNKPVMYFGRGNASMQDDLMDFINYVFGFNGDDSDFYKLLPKLYKPEYDPCYYNYVATEDGKLKSAIGVYDGTLSICGTEFKRRGVGNVAVHPFARSKGYMRKLLNMAIDDMITDGVAISDLGGRRQRYGFFSYDKACVAHIFGVNGNNLRYVYGDRQPHPYTFVKVTADNAAALDEIFALSNSQPIHMVREREKLYDILINWRNEPYAIYDGDAFAGYFVRGGNSLTEFTLKDDSQAAEVVFAYMKSCGRWDCEITVPLFKPKQAMALADLAEDVECDSGEMITVFDFEGVVRALMQLSAVTSLTPLADGKLTLLIHGRAGDEKITIKVDGGTPTVEKADCEPDMELSHLDALGLLFSVYSSKREFLAAAPKSWFPLPIYILSPDAV